MSKVKEREEHPAANGTVITVGKEGSEASNAVVALITEALVKAKDDRARVSVGTNLDLTKFAGKAWLLKAGSPGDYEVTMEKPLRMTAHAYVVFPDSTEDEKSGEIKEHPRAVLFDKDGKTFRTAAAHAPTRLLIVCAMYSPQQWVEGIPFVITARRGKRDRVYHDIQIDTSAAYTL